MLLGINLLLLEKVNVARHNLLLPVLQALVDGKKVIIIETSGRRDLQLEDAEGIECLPNADIFEQLGLIGYEKPSQKLKFYKSFFSPQWKFFIHTILQCLSAKSTAWNEFSSTMASAIICLATNQKFNFSKYIFESMVKNVDSSVKFLMYPRFVQVFLDKQVGDMSTHDEIFVTPSHTKKVFGNMKRVGKGFSRAVTPLFPTMMVQDQEEMGEEPIADEAAKKENVLTHSNDPLLSGEDSLKLNDLMETCTKLQQRVLDLENTKTAQAQEISSLKLRVKRLENKGGSRTHKLKILFKGRKIDNIDKDAEVTLVDETQGRYGDDLVFDTTILDGEEVFAGQDVVEKEWTDVGRLRLVEWRDRWVNNVPVKPVNMVQPLTPERVFSSPSKEYVKPVKPVNSPYMCRRIDVTARCKRVEFVLGNSLFAMEGDKMELYMINRPHGRMILASIEKGPLVWPSITVDGVKRLKEYTELTPAEAIQADCDIKEINIILQGLSTEIYALVSQQSNNEIA
ncbi:hypothetical protein Tco_0784013, partial [Tanacetum coccineum]